MVDFKAFYSKHLRLAWATIVFIPIIILTLCCIQWPSIFYDGFVWKYLIGPIVADARNHPVDGITEGYNLVNTATYALFLIVCLVGLYELFNRKVIYEFEINTRVLIAVLPYLVLGGMLRALEDCGFFTEPMVYLFIAPVIYITIAFTAAAFMTASIYAYKLSRKSYKTGMLFAIATFICINVFYSIAYIINPSYLSFYPHPGIFVLMTIITILALYFVSLKEKTIRVSDMFAVLGILLLLLTAYVMAFWTHVTEWTLRYFSLTGVTTVQTHIWELAIIAGIALSFTVAIYFFSFLLSKKHRRYKAFLVPITILMSFAQFLDGAATYRGMTAYGYTEKHVLTAGIMDLMGNAAVLFGVKLIIVVAVVLVVDFLYERELAKYPGIPIIVKGFVVMLGLSPGTRDMCRIAMGV